MIVPSSVWFLSAVTSCAVIVEPDERHLLVVHLALLERLLGALECLQVVTPVPDQLRKRGERVGSDTERLARNVRITVGGFVGHDLQPRELLDAGGEALVPLLQRAGAGDEGGVCDLPAGAPVLALMAAASVWAARQPPRTLSVARNESYFVVVTAESIMMTLMPAVSAFAMTGFRAVAEVDAMTRKSGFFAMASSTRLISAVMSASEGPPT